MEAKKDITMSEYGQLRNQEENNNNNEDDDGDV